MYIYIHICLYNAGAIEKSSHSIYLQDPYKMQASCQDHAYQIVAITLKSTHLHYLAMLRFVSLTNTC